MERLDHLIHDLRTCRLIIFCHTGIYLAALFHDRNPKIRGTNRFCKLNTKLLFFRFIACPYHYTDETAAHSRIRISIRAVRHCRPVKPVQLLQELGSACALEIAHLPCTFIIHSCFFIGEHLICLRRAHSHHTVGERSCIHHLLKFRNCRRESGRFIIPVCHILSIAKALKIIESCCSYQKCRGHPREPAVLTACNNRCDPGFLDLRDQRHKFIPGLRCSPAMLIKHSLVIIESVDTCFQRRQKDLAVRFCQSIKDRIRKPCVPIGIFFHNAGPVDDQSVFNKFPCIALRTPGHVRHIS